jgi:O-antigen/teichoic acid export membrane protein
MLAYSFIDTVILERIRGEEEAGIYAQSSRLLMALTNFSYLFSVPLLPMFARMIAQKQSFKELLHLAGSTLILSSIFISVSCAFYAEEIISALYAQKEGLSLLQKLTLSIYGELNNIENIEEIKLSSEVFRIYILNFIPISCLYIYGTFLTAAGEIKSINLSSALAVLLNLSCNLLLIPLYGVKGAAIVSLITQSFVCLFQVYYMRRKFKLNIQLSLTIRYITSLVFFIIILLALHQQDISWIINIAISIFSSLLFSAFTKAIPTPHLADIVKLKRT